MRNNLIFLSLFLIHGRLQSQNVAMIKLPALQKMMVDQHHKIQVINFWATWCGPCVKELPLFEKLNLLQNDVRVILVSMDIDLDADSSKVFKFVLKNKINSTVFILNEKNPNSWIDKIEKNWSGSLPATLIINSSTGKRIFIERELHEGEIEKLIDTIK